MRRFLAITCLLAGLPLVANAEYRIALLIDNHPEKDVAPVEAGLKKYGFACETLENTSGKELENRVSGWAGNSPTNSTALIYYCGPVEDKDGEPSIITAGMKGGSKVSGLISTMTTRGGNRVRLFVADSDEKVPFNTELEPGCLLAYADLSGLAARGGNDADLIAGLGEVAKSTLAPGTTLAGMGSVAISPPDKFGPGRKAGDEWVNANGMIFVWCPPGRFTAGSPEGTPGRFIDENIREVVIKDGFWIAKYELTEIQNPRNRNPEFSGEEKNFPKAGMHWDDGKATVEKVVTEQERKAGRLPDGWQYHLPSADQWEYAARAGTATLFYFGDDVSELRKHANFADKSYYDTGDVFSNYAHRTWDDGFPRLAPVGRFKPNPWGLYDVYGNASEWCRDSAVLGGGWVSVAANCRSAYRDSRSSRDSQDFLGYRWVIQPNIPEEIGVAKGNKK